MRIESDKRTESVDDTTSRSLELYMEELADYPPLTKPAEKEALRAIADAKITILSYAVKNTECLASISLLRAQSSTVLRSLFSRKGDKNFSKEKLLELAEELGTLIQQAAKKKPQGLLEFLQNVEFSTKQVLELAEPVKRHTAVAEAVKSYMHSRELLATHNQRLVMAIAKKYEGSGLSWSDLAQEGSVGLMRAIEKFNPDLGLRFTTFATYWIKQSCRRALDNKSRIVRVPVYVAERLNRLAKATYVLTKELGRDPKNCELAKYLDISEKELKELKKYKLSPKHLEDVVAEEGGSLAEFIADDGVPAVEESLHNKNLVRDIRGLVGDLTEMEERVIRLSLGLGEATPQIKEY